MLSPDEQAALVPAFSPVAIEAVQASMPEDG